LAKSSRTGDEEKRLAKLEADLVIAGQAFQQFLDTLADEFGNSQQASEKIF
jgi:hypothetical protein